MVPDYSFALYFPAAARAAAVTALSRLCTKETAGALQALLHHEGDTTAAEVVLTLESDLALARWRADHPDMHSGAPMNEVRVGVITVWVEDIVADNCVCVTLWPVTRGMQIACLESPTLRRALVALLVDNEGIVGHLDRGDGSVAELWPHDDAPPGYEHHLARRV